MGTIALLGATGFVGSNIAQQCDVTHYYDSKSIRSIAGRDYDEIICAAAPGTKWKANADPDGDHAAISGLIACLSTVSAKRFTLISTIDVYSRPDCRGDETTEIDLRGLHPYGKHRLELERWAFANTQNCLVVRLPALFGSNLRKNALFDLIHDNQTEKLNPLSVFQWYPLQRLTADIQIARAAGHSVVNLFSEPVELSEIARRFFPGRSLALPRTPAPYYDVRTRYSALFGGPSGYIIGRDQIMARIETFIEQG